MNPTELLVYLLYWFAAVGVVVGWYAFATILALWRSVWTALIYWSVAALAVVAAFSVAE